MEGVDYAGDRPNPDQLFAAGKRFVVRYGGPGGSWKHIDAAEARALDAAGLSLVANAEGAADGLLGGWNAGASWAREADAHFRALGMPASKPIYLSVDFDVSSAQWPTVAQALRGAESVIGAARVGVYGSYDAMVWARRDGVAAWFWQTYAWSGGRWAGHNHIEQYRNGVFLAGGTVDLCRSKTADFGQWTLSEEDDMTPQELIDTRLGSPALGDRTVGDWWKQGEAARREAAAAKDAAKAAADKADALAAKVDELLARPPAGAVVVDQAQLEAALRTVLGSVDGATPPPAG